jgi:hypothetical protein
VQESDLVEARVKTPNNQVERVHLTQHVCKFFNCVNFSDPDSFPVSGFPVRQSTSTEPLCIS